MHTAAVTRTGRAHRAGPQNQSSSWQRWRDVWPEPDLTVGFTRCVIACPTLLRHTCEAPSTRLYARCFAAALAPCDQSSGSRGVGRVTCRSIHPVRRARVRNGREPSRARGSQRAGTSPRARPDPTIGNRAPSPHSGRTAGCGHGRLPKRDGRLPWFERPRCPPGRTSAAMRATSG